MALLGTCGGGFKFHLNHRYQCVCLYALIQLYFQLCQMYIPQGSILIGTFPVLVHINDLSLSIHHSSALSFADDTKLFKLIFELTDSLIALVRSQLLYWSPLWHLYLIQDISTIQYRATKYVLNNYISDYKTRLIKLNLLPLMYTYDLCDILFFINQFNNHLITLKFNL